jgi:hypothetical protein
MKKLYYSIFIIVISTLFVSCENDNEGNSIITKPATIELNGDATIYIAQGNSYTEEGVTITGGTLYKTIGMVATDRPGSYTIQYIAINSDGAYTTAQRNVIVFGLGDGSIELAGDYAGYRGTSYGTDITITKIATGVYSVPDMFGGFYEYFRGYGSAFRCPGIIRYEGNGIVTMPVWSSSPWGPFNFLDDEGTVDSEGTISYKIVFDDGTSIATAFRLVKK